MAYSKRERLWTLFCSALPLWYLALITVSVLLLLQLFALAIGSLSTETTYILGLNFVLLLPLLVVTLFVISRCGQAANDGL